MNVFINCDNIVLHLRYFNELVMHCYTDSRISIYALPVRFSVQVHKFSTSSH